MLYEKYRIFYNRGHSIDIDNKIKKQILMII
jgi:hypothetical protein